MIPNDINEMILTSSRIKNFFNVHPNGFINIVQSDNLFKLTKDIPFSVDKNSITLINCVFTKYGYGVESIKKGDFMIPFNHILRIEFIKYEK